VTQNQPRHSRGCASARPETAGPARRRSAACRQCADRRKPAAARLRDVLHALDGHAARRGGLVAERAVRELGRRVEQRLLVRREAAAVAQQVRVPAAARRRFGALAPGLLPPMRMLVM